MKVLKFKIGDRAWLEANCTKKAMPDKDRVLKYLRSCRVVAASTRLEPDLLGGGGYLGPGGLEFASDGAWLWVRQIDSLIERFNFKLPPEFVKHMSDSDWTPPTKVKLPRPLPVGDVLVSGDDE